MRGTKRGGKRIGGARSLATNERGLIAPTPERLQHGAVVRQKRQLAGWRHAGLAGIGHDRDHAGARLDYAEHAFRGGIIS